MKAIIQFVATLGLMIAAFAAAPAMAQQKIALVIGNETYGAGLQPLPFATTDAQQMAQALSRAGFVDGRTGAALTPARNLGKTALVQAVRDFDAKLDTAPEGTVAMLYFAGHGVARERRGDVYLLPVDADIRTGANMDDIGLPLSDVLQLLRSHKGRTVILVVDACRNIPAVATAANTRSVVDAGAGWGDDESLGSGGLGLLSRGAGRDFSSRTPDAADYFVAFSTSPDRAAYDSDLFSGILADEIGKGRHDVLTLFKRVGERMAEESRAQGALQLPTYEVGIYTRPPCFGVCPPESDPARFFDCSGCPWMRAVQPGQFLFGSPAGEEGRDRDERLAAPAQITRAYAIGEYEVTRAEWKACERAGACRALTTQGRFLSEKAPISGITREDAEAFLGWLSRRSGVTYRLPTDAEWEYAARAGRQDVFPFGNTIEPAVASYDYSTSYAGSRRAEYLGQPSSVGAFPPNPFSLYDMAGNMWEWAADCPAATGCASAVLRGGSYKSRPDELRSANRLAIRPTERREDVGLRVARDIAP